VWQQGVSEAGAAAAFAVIAARFLAPSATAEMSAAHNAFQRTIGVGRLQCIPTGKNTAADRNSTHVLRIAGKAGIRK
jgi:hypothetical protein